MTPNTPNPQHPTAPQPQDTYSEEARTIPIQPPPDRATQGDRAASGDEETVLVPGTSEPTFEIPRESPFAPQHSEAPAGADDPTVSVSVSGQPGTGPGTGPGAGAGAAGGAAGGGANDPTVVVRRPVTPGAEDLTVVVDPSRITASPDGQTTVIGNLDLPAGANPPAPAPADHLVGGQSSLIEGPGNQQQLTPSITPSTTAPTTDPTQPAETLAVAPTPNPTAADPTVAISPATEPFAAEQFAAEPLVDEPIAVEADAVERFAAEPVAAESVVAGAFAAEPVVAETVGVEPVAGEAPVGVPVAGEPAVGGSVAAETSAAGESAEWAVGAAGRRDEFADRLAELTEVRVRYPERVEEGWLGRRTRGLVGEDGRLLIVAADHPARGALGVRGDRMAMGSRADLVARLVIALQRPGVDGVLATPDVLEDLLLLGALEGKVVIGSMNRGGLQGASFELDDRFTAYRTADEIAARRLDGGKMLTRIDLADRGTVATLESSAAAVTGLAEHKLMAMVEPFWSTRSEDGRVTNLLDPESVIKSIQIASALGATSAYTWLKLPVVDELDRVMEATTLPTLLLGGDPTGDPEATYSAWGKALDLPSVRGLVVGRALLFPPDGDVATAVDRAAALVHGGAA